MTVLTLGHLTVKQLVYIPVITPIINPAFFAKITGVLELLSSHDG